MTKREKAEKRIRELSIALDMMNEDIEFYEKLFGGKKALENWKNY